MMIEPKKISLPIKSVTAIVSGQSGPSGQPAASAAQAQQQPAEKVLESAVSAQQSAAKPAAEAQTDDPQSLEAWGKSGDHNVIKMHEKIVRPEVLEGCTYKIKPAGVEHAMYVTINDYVVGPGRKRPFEIFINTKNMEHFHWIVALTRMMSAIFRKGGDLMFIIEELRSVFDARGGHYRKGGKFVNSVVAEIGDVIDIHMQRTGHANAESSPPSNKIGEKVGKKIGEKIGEKIAATAEAETQQEAVMRCSSCQSGCMVNQGGCLVCMECGFSKCD